MINTENITLSKINQIQKDKYDFTHMNYGEWHGDLVEMQCLIMSLLGCAAHVQPFEYAKNH
jgi:hypothetical protein